MTFEDLGNMFDDPYPAYAAVREAEPVAELGPSYWRVSSYEAVAAVLRDPRTSVRRPPPDASRFDGEMRALVAGLNRYFDQWLLMIDPPDHTRIRQLVSGEFTPRVIQAMRDQIERSVAELLGRVRDHDCMDVMAELASPLPTRVIAGLLGLPAEDAHQLKLWSEDLVAIPNGNVIAFFGDPDEIFLRAGRAMRELEAYLLNAVDVRRGEPRDDLLSGLVSAQARGAILSDDELIANVVLILVAGHETTTNLIGNGTLALLRHPDQLERLRSDPSLVPLAVEELLRYDSPLQGTGRLMLVDLDVCGHTLRAGEWVDVWIGAAHRDPAAFPEPDRVDVGRRDAKHLAFGHGAHYCLGAPLARLEGEIAFRQLIELPIELGDEPPRWRPNPVLRGLSTLPVRLAR